MELFEVTEAFSSLSQETRLRVFKVLVEYGCDGAIPSKIAAELDIPDNTLSFHLSHMSRAGLVTSKKEGRSITYFANHALIQNLIMFMQENCCEKQSSKMSVKGKSVKTCNERKC